MDDGPVRISVLTPIRSLMMVMPDSQQNEQLLQEKC